jgi:hypothetical protein
MMNNNLELYLMMHQEKLFEVERLNQHALRNRPPRQKRRFELRRLFFFL